MVKFLEQFFKAAIWIIIVLIVVGFILKFATDRGFLPGVAAWIGAHTNLQAQAGG